MGILQELLEVGFLTGSRAFKTNNAYSDYDIVYSIDDSNRIDSITLGLKRTDSDYFNGFYINTENKIINLIPVHPHEYLPWYLATKAMKETFKQSEIIDPIKKYSLFMGIVCLFKGMVKPHYNLNGYDEIKTKINNNF